ncbi:uncharacterized protein LOC110828316 [Zootermopsis nevadensis]|uniref:uncharacterized protein LOC110828316 n=1 Tax=Zootermopsis nevadensis TaxID=136037 RepID=UPI000B8E3141|nr:uncharacterized protein LOC110828316 [Zootermopsis nevadensis]
MAVSVRNVCSAVTLLAVLCACVEAAYFYSRDGHQQGRSAGASSHHKHHGVGSRRLQQAGVGVVSRGRFVTHSATTVTTTPSGRLSPLDRLINRLDSEERKSVTRFDQGNGRHESPHSGRYPSRDALSSALRSPADHSYAQLRSNIDDSYEDDDDDDEDEEDDDVIDGEEEEEEEERASRGRHGNHRTGDVPWYDGAVADFPDHPPASSAGSSGSRWGGFTSYSDWKWHALNKPNMDMLRNHQHKATYKPTSPEGNLEKAVQHAVMVGREAQCRVPKPRLVQVKDMYPHPSKTYIPHCTILHQCGDDTGCCKSDTLTCTARKTESVELYFYTTTLRASGGSRNKGGPSVEKLVFHNHTECVCVDRLEEFMPRDRPIASSEKDKELRGHHHPDADSSRTDSDNESGTSESCRCTSQFAARRVDGSCVCECFDKQRDCIRSKRGKEYLPYDDRICVLRAECVVPSCEFGTYLRRAGRCPRKREKFEAWQQVPLHDEEYK